MIRVSMPGILLALLLLMPLPVWAAAPDDDAAIVHLLNRISFGPAPGDIEAVRREGIDRYIEQQLYPERMLPSQALEARLAALPTVNASMVQLAEEYQKPNEGKLSPEERKALNKKRRTILLELSQAKILRAVMSPAQLQEVMTDFWFNHFNVFFGKGLDSIFIGPYERDAVRPYALGKFRDLLEATARHPAMLFYLDNWQNTAPDSVLAQRAARRGKELGINENYAREIMELHTLGVNGGYTQQDVTTLAHILTGWGLGRGKDWADKASFYFDPDRHDFANQVFLGQPIRGGGTEEIESVLDRLASSPATAHHISYELAQYFVADDPPQSLVDRLTQTFEASDGDIKVVLRALFHSSEFWDPKYRQVKFKPPFRYIVSSLRAAGVVPQGDTRMLQGAMDNMGEPLYRCQTPNGYADTNDQWLNSDALLKRITVAKGLERFLDGQSAAAILATRGNDWSANTITTSQGAELRMRPVLLLSSPEFLYY